MAFIFLLLTSLTPLFSVRAKTYPRQVQANEYPLISIKGSGTLTSNITEATLQVSFTLEGEFWTVQQVTIPRLEVEGLAEIYNVTGTITVEDDVQDVSGVFANITYDSGVRWGNFFIVNVANTTTELLTFFAVVPNVFLVELPSGRNAYARFSGLSAAMLIDSDYPSDFFITYPPRFMMMNIIFPKP